MLCAFLIFRKLRKANWYAFQTHTLRATFAYLKMGSSPLTYRPASSTHRNNTHITSWPPLKIWQPVLLLIYLLCTIPRLHCAVCTVLHAFAACIALHYTIHCIILHHCMQILLNRSLNTLNALHYTSLYTLHYTYVSAQCTTLHYTVKYD